MSMAKFGLYALGAVSIGVLAHAVLGDKGGSSDNSTSSESSTLVELDARLNNYNILDDFLADSYTKGSSIIYRDAWGWVGNDEELFAKTWLDGRFNKGQSLGILLDGHPNCNFTLLATVYGPIVVGYIASEDCYRIWCNPKLRLETFEDRRPFSRSPSIEDLLLIINMESPLYNLSSETIDSIKNDVVYKGLTDDERVITKEITSEQLLDQYRDDIAQHEHKLLEQHRAIENKISVALTEQWIYDVNLALLKSGLLTVETSELPFKKKKALLKENGVEVPPPPHRFPAELFTNSWVDLKIPEEGCVAIDTSKVPLTYSDLLPDHYFTLQSILDIHPDRRPPGYLEELLRQELKLIDNS
jgi:hypothetical protein